MVVCFVFWSRVHVSFRKLEYWPTQLRCKRYHVVLKFTYSFLLKWTIPEKMLWFQFFCPTFLEGPSLMVTSAAWILKSFQQTFGTRNQTLLPTRSQFGWEDCVGCFLGVLNGLTKIRISPHKPLKVFSGHSQKKRRLFGYPKRYAPKLSKKDNVPQASAGLFIFFSKFALALFSNRLSNRLRLLPTALKAVSALQILQT